MFILLIKLGLAIKKLEKDEIYLNWRKTHQKSSKSSSSNESLKKLCT